MRRADPDPQGRYVLVYETANPWFYRPKKQRMVVTGRSAMETTRRTLRESGYRVLNVTRRGWFT